MQNEKIIQWQNAGAESKGAQRFQEERVTMKTVSVLKSGIRRARLAFFRAAFMLSPRCSSNAEDSKCFLRHGDRWTAFGDSITSNGTYVRMVRRMLHHFHPGADITLNGIGINGVAADHAFAEGSDAATVVSIMLGTNDAIHSGYDKVDKQKILDSYRQSMLKRVKSHQAKGSIVLLFSSPLTDEDFGRGWWELRNSNAIIKEFPRILKEIAKETGAWYIPVQEEMRSYRDYLQAAFGIVRPLYPDGVHPNGWSQYQIARTIYERLNVAGRLLEKGEERRLSPAPKPVPAGVSLNAKFLEDGDALTLYFQSAESTKVNVRWSYGARRGEMVLDITPKGVAWTVPLKQEDFDLKPGQNRELVFDLGSGANRSVYILDITSTRVWHLNKENTIAGDVPLDSSPKHGSWNISKCQGGLLLSGAVSDDDIQADGDTFSSKDGVHLILDLRQGPRFADLSFDEDVHFLCLNVQQQPLFGLGIAPFLGRGMSFAGNGGAQKTADGYKWHFFISGGFKDGDKSFTVEKSDFIGFNIDIVDKNVGADGKCRSEWIKLTKTDYAVQNFPSFLQIIDMKNKLKGNEVKVLNLWGF